MKNINRRLISLLIGAVILVGLTLTCATAPNVDFGGLGRGTDNVPLNSQVLTGYLPNGVRYFILENAMPENRAHLSLVVNAGSVLETEYQRGYAHFVEHMAFRGTARFPEQELIEYLRSLGMRSGPDLNAFVSFNETVYHFDVPTEIIGGVRRIPDKALAILDDWSFQISFNPEDVDLERLVVLEEIRFIAGAQERLWRITNPIIFAGSPYADRHPLGLAEVIENATPESLRVFYDRWYRSDNIALIFIGDFDGQVLQAQLYQHFNMPKAEEPVNRPSFDLPPPVRNNFHVEVFTDPELPGTGFQVFWKQGQGAPRGTIAHYRETVIDNLIATMLNLRFEEAAADPDSASTSAWGQVSRWFHNSRYYIMGTSPKTGMFEQAIREMLLEKESMRRFGFTDGELQRAKRSLISSMERQLSERDRLESRTFHRRLTNHFLLGQSMPDLEWEMMALNALLPGITNREIASVVSNYFAHNDVRIFVMANEAEKENLPSPQRIRAIFREVRNARLTPRHDVTLSDNLLDRVPQPGVIESITPNTGTDAVTLTMANGARVIFKETENRNNEVILFAMANGGTTNATEDTIVSVRLLPDMLDVSGLGDFSRIELINMLAGKEVSFSFWMSNYDRGFQGSSTTQDLETLFEMIHLFFTNPRLDERAIEAMINQYRTALLHQDESPDGFFRRELTRFLNGNHPLFMPLEFGDMDRVSVTQAHDFLARTLNPGDYTFVFVGNFDPETMKELSQTYIASIPNSASMNSWTDPRITHPAQGRRTINMGIDNRCIAHIEWIALGEPAFNEQRNQVAAVLSEYLRIVVWDEIREVMGGVYALSAGASISSIPVNQYRISVRLFCDPERAEELISAVKRLVTDLSVNPLNLDTFNSAREALLVGHERDMQRNSHITRSFANSAVLFNTPLNRLHLRPEAVRAVTPQDVQNLLRQIITNGPVELVLFPE
ncbi:MAG: insulinase family protein [Treponema sp.]|nr:insulinase family protein [Treponema sp.]